MTDLEKLICESLNMFCFLNIWNEPTSEYRVNIKPIMLNENSKKGSISINGSLIQLPTTNEPYYLYSISTDCFRNAFWLPQMTWVDSVTLCNNYNVLMHVYTEFGFMCSHGKCYLMLLPSKSAYILAISKTALNKIIKHENSDMIYVTIYKDSDIANKTTVYSYNVPPSDKNGNYRLSIIKKIQEINDKQRTIVYHNGYEVEFSDSTLLNYGDLIDIIHDTNIITSYIVDLTDSKQYNIFYSEKDKLDKVLIHTPKECNPINKVLTHNTADFFLRRKTPLRFLQEGLYIQRTADRSIGQVTHQDFSIPTFIVDAYRDYLQTQAVTVRVIIRQHDKDNILIRDKNYIDMLYTQDDATIVDCLMNKKSGAPEFWSASNLENSVYVNMMFDIPDIITSENMYTYIEGLGYYHTISLICQRVTTETISDLWGNFISFNKPYLFANKPIYPILYHNGKKIHADDYLLSNENSSTFDVTFLNNVFEVGDKIDVEMFLDGNRQTFDFTVTESNLSIKIPYTDVLVYELIDNSPSTVSAVDYSTSFSYRKITNFTGLATVSIDNEKNEITYTFSIKNIGKTYIFQNKYCVRPLNLTSILKEKINNGDSLAFQLETYTNNQLLVPIFEPQSVQVFLNGKYLINKLDYFIKPIQGFNNEDISGNQLIIQNKSYLLGENKDSIECIITSAEVEDTTFGFIKNNKIIPSIDDSFIMWFENISTCHIEGTMELNIVNMSTHMEVPENKYRQGAPYELCTNIPKIVKDFIDQFHENDDRERMQIINDYFHGTPLKINGPIILPFSHQIYSVYLNEIISDILLGKLQLAFDPDIPRLIKQVAPYNYLKSYDLIYNDISALDVTYIDIFPTYVEWKDVDEETYRLIHSLIEQLLPEDDFSSGEIINVNN